MLYARVTSSASLLIRIEYTDLRLHMFMIAFLIKFRRLSVQACKSLQVIIECSFEGVVDLIPGVRVVGEKIDATYSLDISL